VDHPHLGRFPICLFGDREKIHSTLRLPYLEGLHSPSVLFVLPGKLNVRSVPHADLVKIAQPTHPWVKETLRASGMDPANGLSVATVDKAYVRAFEGNENGAVIEPRQRNT
jgi:hypothetical protein